jgi:hypothetical protein
MARGKSRTLTIDIAGDQGDLEKSVKKSNRSLDSLGKQTRVTSSITSKGFAAMKIGATGAAAGIAGLAIATKKVVEASIESEKSNARMVSQLKALGISYDEHAAKIEKVIQKTSQLAGLDDEDLQDAFTALVRTTGDVNKSLNEMALVADLARAKNMEVGRAGEFIAKIHAGNVGGLRRLGLEFTKTTENADKLKAAHERTAAAQKVNKQRVDELSQADIKFAQAQDQRANSERALSLLRSTFSGQATAYGKTTAGAVDRANVAFENLQETIGAAVAPTVQKAATATAKFVNEMQDGTGQGGRFVRKLKDIWEEVRPIVLWMGRAARAVGQFVAEHPGVVKLTASIVAVGVAVKALRFVSAATGFSTFLKVGTSAAKLLRRRLVENAAAGGAEAAVASAGGFSSKSSKFTAAGTKAGRLVGRGLAIGAVVGAAAAASDALDEVVKQIRKRFGDLAGDAANTFKGPLGLLENLTGKDLTPGASDLMKLLPGRAAGGIIPGSGRGDIVPTMLEPGEFVIRRKVVEKFGPAYFANINGGMGAGGTRYANGGIVSLGRELQREGYQVGEHPAFGGVAPVHVPNSYHYKAMALDVNGGPGGEPGSLDALYNRLKGHAGIVELLWRVAGHFDHLHVAVAGDRNPLTGALGKAGEGVTGGSVKAGPSKAELAERRRARTERSGSRVVNKLVARFGGGSSGFAAAGRSAAALGGAIEGADTAYGQLERQFGQTDEDLGTPGGRTARLGELGALAQEKRKQLDRQKKRAALLRQAVSKLEGLLKAGRKQRDRAKGAKRAKISERLRSYDDRLTDLKAELMSLGFAIRDTELDIGDLAKEAKDVAGTPNTEVEPGPTVTERTSDLTSLIDLKERAGLIDAATAKQQRIDVIGAAIAGKLGTTTDREQLQLLGDLKEAQDAGVQAVEDNTSALRDLQKSIDDNTAFARSVMATEAASLTRSVADLISGQIAGVGIAGRALMPGTAGMRARY